MDLQLATTDDILNELHQRRMRFVFAGVENTNDPGSARVFCAGQGPCREDLLSLLQQLQLLFQAGSDSDINDSGASE